MYCSNCGKELPNGSTSCSFCSAEFGNRNMNQTESETVFVHDESISNGNMPELRPLSMTMVSEPEPEISAPQMPIQPNGDRMHNRYTQQEYQRMSVKPVAVKKKRVSVPLICVAVVVALATLFLYSFFTSMRSQPEKFNEVVERYNVDEPNNVMDSELKRTIYVAENYEIFDVYFFEYGSKNDIVYEMTEVGYLNTLNKSETELMTIMNAVRMTIKNHPDIELNIEREDKYLKIEAAYKNLNKRATVISMVERNILELEGRVSGTSYKISMKDTERFLKKNNFIKGKG